MTKVKLPKVTKINLMITVKRLAELQTSTNSLLKFQNYLDNYRRRCVNKSGHSLMDRRTDRRMHKENNMSPDPDRGIHNGNLDIHEM